MTRNDAAEITLYGSAISYYTGKLEGYLRYKEIPYRFVPMSPAISRRLQKETGASQIPGRARIANRFLTEPVGKFAPSVHRVVSARRKPQAATISPNERLNLSRSISHAGYTRRQIRA